MQYIDTDKIRSEVKRIQETDCESPISVCNDILSFIDFLQHEQSSLSDNLDEAAHSYSESDEPLYSPGHRFHWDNDSLFGKQIETAFKAGAEWAIQQLKVE